MDKRPLDETKGFSLMAPRDKKYLTTVKNALSLRHSHPTPNVRENSGKAALFSRKRAAFLLPSSLFEGKRGVEFSRKTAKL
jgi:hypothetical protein